MGRLERDLPKRRAFGERDTDDMGFGLRNDLARAFETHDDGRGVAGAIAVVMPDHHAGLGLEGTDGTLARAADMGDELALCQ